MANQRRITMSLAAGITCLMAAAPLQAEDSQASEVSLAEAYAASAYEAYGRKDYAEAVDLYQQAFQAAPSADILYNLARIHDTKLKDRKTAIEYYRRYTADTGAEPSRLRTATQRLTELTELEEIAAEPNDDRPASAITHAPPPETIAPPPQPTAAEASGGISGVQVAGIISGSVGMVSLGLGLGFGVAARSDADTAHDLCNGNACRSQRGVDAAEDASRAATLSTAAFIAGGVLTALGVTLLVVGGGRGEDEVAAVRLTPYAGRDGAGTSIAGEF